MLSENPKWRIQHCVICYRTYFSINKIFFSIINFKNGWLIDNENKSKKQLWCWYCEELIWKSLIFWLYISWPGSHDEGVLAETNGCQETTSDSTSTTVWPSRKRSTRGAYEQLSEKVFLLYVPLGANDMFSLICFAQLNFRGHHATSRCKEKVTGQRLSLALVKQGLH